MNLTHISLLAILLIGVILISGCIGRQQTEPVMEKVIFTPPAELPEATVDIPYSYSFCEPQVKSLSDLCGDFEETTNPTGGNPPYYFSLGSGVGFPPLGITLNNNGLLAGTPTAAGKSTFQVCAVDEGGRQACQKVSLTVKPKSEQPENVTRSVKIESANAMVKEAYRDECGDIYWCTCIVEVSGVATLGINDSLSLFQTGGKEHAISCPSWDEDKENTACVRSRPEQPATGEWSLKYEQDFEALSTPCTITSPELHTRTIIVYVQGYYAQTSDQFDVKCCP